eukprot:jgi/Astpho2/647/Aster-04487
MTDKDEQMTEASNEEEDWDQLNAEGPEDPTEDGTPEESYHSDDEEAEMADRAEVARREKERLKAMEKYKREQLEKLKQDGDASASEGESGRANKRLQFLLKQAEVFQHFAPGTAETETKKKDKKRGRHGTKYTEDMEDADLLKDEEVGGAQGHRLTVQPSVIKGGKMRDYQMQGLNWLIHLYDNGISGILADEMGLGKTLQTISLLGYLHEYRGITGPYIVIVPKSTLHNWMNEFRKWCPVLRATKFHGNQEEREQQKANNVHPGKFDVVVTSYEMVIKEKNHFKKFHWRYIIIDEAHRIKNENSILSRTVRMFKTNYRLLITGTPLQNNLHELWALLNFLLPEVFGSAEKFDEWFKVGTGDKEAEASVVEQLHKVLRPFLLRRIKSDVEKSLPPKKETILKIGMSEMQKKWYRNLLSKDIEALHGGAERTRLLNIVMQLRKCCNHPYLFQGAEPGPPYTQGDHLITNSGKMVLLDKLLPRLHQRGSRVLIFSQMTRLLDILEDYCVFRGHSYCRIDGNTTGEDRESQIDAYNAEGSEKFVFLLSTRAGGLGINLYTADIVVLYDSDWNPQMDLQARVVAMDRAHRIGQKKEVQVFRFCTEHSIEEKVIEKALKKLKLDAMVIQQGRMQDSNKTVGKDDLLQMVRYGAELVFSGGGGTGEEATRDLNAKLAQFTENAMKFTMDGGMSLDEYKDEDDEDNTDYKKMAPQQPRVPRMPNLYDFQFFNIPRIQELYEKEHAAEQHKHSLQEKESTLKKQGASEDAIQAELAAAASPEDPQSLTEEELEERTQLLDEGFKDWSRRDFSAFVRACTKYGRNALSDVAREVEGKTEEEVRAYSKVFWKRHKDINDWEKHIKNIEGGEARIQRQTDIMNAIASKMNRYKNPHQELKIMYGANKGKAYTEEEDRFILCQIHTLGYGQWDELKAAIREHWRFRFDWFFKSRTPQELMRRCDTLIRLVEKENEDFDAAEREERKKGGGKKAGAASRATDSSGAAGASKFFSEAQLGRY